MLARKHYAQKGNSKGKMNTSSLTGSTSTAIRNKIKTQADCNVAKLTNYQMINSGYHTERVSYETQKCTIVDNTTTRSLENCNACDYRFKTYGGIRTNRVSNLFKDLATNTQSDYIHNAKEKRSCLEVNDPKPIRSGLTC